MNDFAEVIIRKRAGVAADGKVSYTVRAHPILLENARHLLDVPATVERALAKVLLALGVADPYVPIDDLPWRGMTDGFGTPLPLDVSGAKVFTYGEARAAGWLNAAGELIPGKDDELRAKGLLPGCAPEVFERCRAALAAEARPKLRRRRAAKAPTL